MFSTIYNDSKKQWQGVSRVSLYNRDVSIGQVLLSALERQPNEIGQITDHNNVSLTNHQIYLLTIRVAQNLQKLKLTSDSVIGFYAGNSEHLAPILFAALVLGFPINPIDPLYIQHEIMHMFSITKPAIIFCDQDKIELLQSAINEINLNSLVYVFGESVAAGTESVSSLFQETGIENQFVPPCIGDGAKKVAVIACSSGSSGLPKGVCLSHANFLWQNQLQVYPYKSTVIFFSSIGSITGLGIFVITTLRNCKRIQTTKSFSPELLMNIIEEHEVSICISPPSHLALMLEHPDIDTVNLSSLRYFLTGGCAVYTELVEKMNKYLTNAGIWIMYGNTEVCGLISKNCGDGPLNSAGQLAANYTVKIINETGNNCNINEQGEILVQGLYPFLGYYNNPEANQSLIDSDGFVHTGDLGYIDENGHLYVVDRIRDVLKYISYQVSPTEIENLLMKCCPIENVCVVGVPVLGTELPAALVVRKKYSTITEAEICDVVKENLWDAKQLRGGVYFVDSLPMLASDKVNRREVREIVNRLYMEKNGTNMHSITL